MVIQDIQTPEVLPRVKLSPASDGTAPLEYYYDFHPTEKDLMGQGKQQDTAIDYLRHVLKYYYRVEGWYIAVDLNIYQTRKYRERPLAPDIAVFIGIPESTLKNVRLRSWQMVLPGRPAPRIVFEFASDSTKEKDQKIKPDRYGVMGVSEYVYYDPWLDPDSEEVRLRAWTYVDRRPQELPCNEGGWIWSEVLQSWLAPDGEYLRLYDSSGMQRPTGEEAERAAKEAERTAKEAERAAKEAERAAKEAERAAKEETLAALEQARAKLRKMGIDPDTL